MQSAISEYYIGEDAVLRLYFTGTGGMPPSGAVSVLAGTENCSISAPEKAEGHVPIRTLIMLDNSRSVRDFDLCRNLTKEIIANRAEGEEFCLATFDSGLTEIIPADGGGSTDEGLLLEALEGLSQADRSTNVKRALKDALEKRPEDGSLYRIILVSDGGDKAESGDYSMEELLDLLSSDPLLLHCIGIRWESAGAQGLDEMALLGRTYGSYHPLEGPEDEEAILETLSQDYDTWYLDAVIPAGQQDGSIRSVMAEITAADQSIHISKDVRMPQRALPPASPTPTPSTAPTKVPEPVITQETIEETAEIQQVSYVSTAFQTYGLFICGGLILLLIPAAVFFARKNRKKNREEPPDVRMDIPDPDGTELYIEKPEEDPQDLYETQMMFGRPPEKKSKKVIFESIKDPDTHLSAEVSDEVIIGSSSRSSGMVIVGDPTVSRKHAKLCLDGENVTIEDMDSTNGTWLNRERTVSRQVLRTGDLLRFGNTEFVVTLEGGEAA